MTDIVRLEILIDKLAAHEVLYKIRPFPSVTCTVHAPSACIYKGHAITSADLPDAIAYHKMVVFIPEAIYPELQKALKKTLLTYNPLVYESICRRPNWLAKP